MPKIYNTKNISINLLAIILCLSIVFGFYIFFIKADSGAKINFTADTIVSLSGITDGDLYIAQNSEADSLSVSGSTLTVGDIPIASSFILKTPQHNNALKVTPSGGVLNLIFASSNLSSGNITQWTLTASSGTTVSHIVGVPMANTWYAVKTDSVLFNSFQSSASGEVSFTYSGGFSTKVFTIERDITAPSAFSLTSPINNSTLIAPITFSWNADTDPDINHYQLYIDSALDTDNISSGTISTIPTGSLSCGDHTWYVKALDNAGNSTNSETFNLSVACLDHLVITGNNAMNSGASQTITITAKSNFGAAYIDYSGEKSLTFSGANAYSGGSSPTCSDKNSANIPFGSSATLTFTNGVATCNLKLYKVESATIIATDGTYNANDNSLAVTVTDTTPPSTFTPLSPSNNSSISDSRTTLSWNASSDTGSGLAKYQLYLDGNLDTDNISSSATSVVSTNPLSCGSHTWYVKAIDNAGNSTSSDIFNLNISCGGGLPPAAYNSPVVPQVTSDNPQGGFKISINDNALETNTRTVTLKLTAGSDTKKMAISNTSDFIGSSQEDYSLTKIWTLSEGEGNKTVYVKFYTSYGVASETVSDSIILKTNSAENQTGNTANQGSADNTTNSNSQSFYFTQTLQLGSHNTQVTELQDKLKELNFFPQETASNGNFGPATKQAVMDYQKSKGIYPNGIVGPRTRKALNNEEFITNKDHQFTQDLKYNDKNEEVKQLQTRLRDQNFFPYNVSSTGWFGPITEKAVNLFKGFYDLIKNGIVDPAVREVLNR